ncbi:MAG: hypothetical protein ACFFCW_08845 [Candidatus Hodarchaeota archaeon]
MPYVGEGFVRDDFNWLENIVHDGKVDYLRPFTKTTGFFRPMVSLSFGIQYQIHGMASKPYGLFNLLLHLLNIVLVYLLLIRIEKTKPYALGAAILFAFNAKATGMAVGWISGRTTLLFSFFLLLSLYSFFSLSRIMRVRFLLTGVFYFASLLSKETAAAAPIFIFLVTFLSCRESRLKTSFFDRTKKGIGDTAAFILPLIVYFFLRFNSDAITPFNAPDYYKYTFAPLTLLENLIEYAIRAALLDTYVILSFLVLTLAAFVWSKQKLGSKERFDNSAGYWSILWFVIFLLPAIFVPTRSSLYSYFPQVGLHVSALAILFYIWRNTIKNQKVLRNAALIFLCFLLLGWGRYLFLKSLSFGEDGNVSTQFTRQVVQSILEIPSESKIYIIDQHFREKLSPSNLISYGFNSMLNLYYPQKKFKGEIVTPSKATKLKVNPNSFFFIWENGDLRK